MKLRFYFEKVKIQQVFFKYQLENKYQASGRVSQFFIDADVLFALGRLFVGGNCVFGVALLVFIFFFFAFFGDRDCFFFIFIVSFCVVFGRSVCFFSTFFRFVLSCMCSIRFCAGSRGVGSSCGSGFYVSFFFWFFGKMGFRVVLKVTR